MKPEQQQVNVVVIRQRRGPDIVGILVGYDTEKKGGENPKICTLSVEHPFVPIMDYSMGSFNLIPFCPLTDQTLFEFHTKDLTFVHPAKAELASEYLSGLARMNTLSVTDPEERRQEKIDFKKALKTLQISPGTETLQ